MFDLRFQICLMGTVDSVEDAIIAYKKILEYLLDDRSLLLIQAKAIRLSSGVLLIIFAFLTNKFQVY